MTLEERVKKIISERVKAGPIYDNHDFVNDLGTDSLDQVEIVMALEDEFGIEITDEEADRIKTVGDAIKFVSEKV